MTSPRIRSRSAGYASIVAFCSALLACGSDSSNNPGFVFDGASDSGDAGASTGATDSSTGDAVASDSTTVDAKSDSSASDAVTADASSEAAADSSASDSGVSSDSGSSGDSTSAGDSSGSSDSSGAGDSGGAGDSSGAGDSGAGDSSGASDSAAAGDSASDSTSVGDASEAGPAWPKAPSCDGVIGAGEYAAKYVTSGGQTWWMQWDDTALYLALQNANVGEAAVFYLGLGSGVGGITTGQPYDGLTPTLPVPANLVVYAKSTYQEVRIVSSAHAWSLTSPGISCYHDSSGDPSRNDRELAIPWSLIGARPPSFYALMYAVASGGPGTYGVAPNGSLTGSTFGLYFAEPGTLPGAESGAFSTIK